jgi:hypothetical protein
MRCDAMRCDAAGNELPAYSLCAIERSPDAAGNELPDAAGNELPAIERSPDAAGNELPAIERSPDAAGNELPAIERSPDAAGNELPAIAREQGYAPAKPRCHDPCNQFFPRRGKVPLSRSRMLSA